MDKLQADSSGVSLEHHKQEALGAYAEGEREARIAANALQEAKTRSNPTPAATQGSIFVDTSKNANSLFLGGGNGKAAQARTSMVPMSYGEKKAAAKDMSRSPLQQAGGGTLGFRVQTTSAFLTSGTKGISLPSILSGLLTAAKKISDAMREIALADKAMDDRYTNDDKRLAQDLSQGRASATQFVTQQGSKKPTVPAAAVKMMAPPAPKGADKSKSEEQNS